MKHSVEINLALVPLSSETKSKVPLKLAPETKSFLGTDSFLISHISD